ncbi:MAG: GNAT family N-acetyltransferase [Cyanobacteria bacterium P01_G01_bin.38]
MPTPPDIQIDESLSSAEADLLSKHIDDYNAKKTGHYDEHLLQLAARDPAGNLLGGLTGSTGFQWLYIHILWVEENYRDRNIGSSLVTYAEQLGLTRGCRASCLMTFSFQAKAFYEKLGYTIFGQLDDYPESHTLHFMRKQLCLSSGNPSSKPET